MLGARSPHRTTALTTLLVLAALGAAACSRGDGRTLDPPVFPPPATTVPATTMPVASLPGTEPPAPAPLQLVTPWRDGAAVPVRHTCDGEDVAPALTWSNVPPDAVELAITVTDLDAPEFVHWIVLGIPVGITGLAEGELPEGSTSWPNGSGGTEYAGPCPPAGEEHRYVVTVHALNQPLRPADETSATEVVETLNLTSIDQSSVSGTYVRAG